jgi:holliday junction DNA helicase RuvB
MSSYSSENKQDNDSTDLDIETLRPSLWDEYIGQDAVKSTVRLMITAAMERNEPCDHILFHGQAGLGKTTLAYLIGKEMGVSVRSLTGPGLERAGDVAALLTNVSPYEILFIDEIHRIGRSAEEVLYPALESRKLHLVVGKGPSAKTVSIDLPPFMLVGATTKASMLSLPLRSRFGATFRLDYYSPEDIEKIISRSADILGVSIDSDATRILALASRCTPRVANRLLRRARDYTQVRKDGVINKEVIEDTLLMLGIDSVGLEETDRRLLETIISRFGGGPVGVSALSSALSEASATIEDIYEPYLIRLGFLDRTRQGRVITKEGRKHINL